MAQSIRLRFLRIGDDRYRIMSLTFSLGDTLGEVLETIVEKHKAWGLGLFYVGDFRPIFYRTDRAFDDIPQSLDELDERDLPLHLNEEVGEHWPDVTQVNEEHVQLLLSLTRTYDVVVSPQQTTQEHVEDELAQLPSTLRQLTAKQRATVEGFLNKPPPSEAAEPFNFRRQQTSDTDEALYNGRPFDLSGLPVQFYHPVFDNFLQYLEATGPISASEYKNMVEFVHESQEIYDQEHPRLKALLPYLDILLNPDITSEPVVGKCGPSGLVKSTQSGVPSFSAIIEIHDEIGTGNCDPSVLVGEAYGTCWSQPESSRIRNLCCCPSLLIAIAGPWICVLGAVYLDRIVIQPLTDYILLGDHPQRDKHLTRLVRLFRAARTSIAELSEYYKTLELPPASASSAHINIGNPARFFPLVREFQGPSGHTVKFQYEGPIDNYEIHGPVFAARTESGERIVVKFAEQYHIEGHRLLASNGLAPKVLFYRGPTYAGGYHLVIMERIGSGSLYDWARSHAGELAPIRQDVEKALKILHEADLVFGDLRAPNVIVSECDSVRPRGMLVDFDWCGREGEVRYPAAMNEKIGWATGAEAGALIMRQHDRDMLERLFQ
ncbi:kinase domain protein [Ceratobasidium sp. AG-Ba]|nr:kinase domain protein [Ceratobasidium sp. AG-Ba]